MITVDTLIDIGVLGLQGLAYMSLSFLALFFFYVCAKIYIT